MKNELNALLTVSNTVKTLQINGAFRIVATPVSAYGEPITVYKSAKPDHMELCLDYILTHDKAYGKSRHLDSTTPDDLKAEIAVKMREILDEITAAILKEWNNGYIQGKVSE